MSHTPTPWVYAGNGRINSPAEGNVALVPFGGEGVSLEDAEFIVRACNAHAELLAALEECAKYWDGEYNQDQTSVRAAIAAAIAKAKGGEA